jgi:hypothetical protein
MVVNLCVISLSIDNEIHFMMQSTITKKITITKQLTYCRTTSY